MRTNTKPKQTAIVIPTIPTVENCGPLGSVTAVVKIGSCACSVFELDTNDNFVEIEYEQFPVVGSSGAAEVVVGSIG